MATSKVLSRTKAHRLAIFNHKGDVGKTTLTMNIAAALAESGKKVLLVDSDPQCNLTSYLVADDVVDDLLDRSDSDEGRTVWSALQPISEATGALKPIDPYELSLPRLFLLPGDIRLSEFEVDLTDFWAQCLQRKMRGFRGTTALSSLVNEITKTLQVDFVFYDCGPNIGPLNRIILLDCDYFIVPVACDLFSLRALKTLGRTLVGWIQEWSTIVDLAPQDTYLLSGKPQFLGYIPEGFKIYGGQVAAQHSVFLSRIEKDIYSQIIVLLRQIDPKLASGRMQHFKLGQVKNFGSLIPASQQKGIPLYQVQVGSPQQREEARQSFATLASNIVQRVSSLSD